MRCRRTSCTCTSGATGTPCNWPRRSARHCLPAVRLWAAARGPPPRLPAPRSEAITEMGHPLLPAMGVTTVINFQPTAEGKAAITGDFVLIDREVNAVARALQQNGIDVTALHNHALMDTPRLFYMHFWATDDAAKLARGLKAALDLTNSQK